MSIILDCRTCLGQFAYKDTVNIETTINRENSILQAIEQVASIEISETDTFPRQICQGCFRSLESCLTFRQQIITSHIELKKRLQLEVQDPLLVPINPKELVSQNEKLEIKVEEFLNENKQNHDTKEPIEIDENSSDWKDFNDGNNSEDSPFDEEIKPAVVKLKRKRKTKKSIRTNVKHSDTSSESCDSDVPLEELKKEMRALEKKTESKIRIKRENKGNFDEPRLCPICGKLFKSRQNFSSHMTTAHRSKPDKPEKISCLCPDCGRVITGSRQNFVAHRRYHHSDKAQVKKRFTCDHCPRKFYREKNLIIHQRFHKGEKGYVCELCPDKSYTQIGGLILHRRKVHLQTPTCTCNYCGKQFYEKHYLETHIRQWHTGERPFSCEICGKAFSCNGTLLRHRKDSHGEKQPCPKCGKMYTDGELRKHLKRHKIREEGIKRKKYTCEYCGTEMNFTSRKRHLLKQHGIMLKGRGEQAERIPVADAI
ncbi:zinc finger protein 260-like [Anthonomus grandis grandis]|uniref:zinc finger protein 260-like n=1 Tax=Anthonomus grandis grandis TaxID=2921223 RepID=UPI002165F0F9|nr:zinc finger protein 260-like [Anthonomus grandis grandis]